jgi:hypothetical protein
MTLAERTVFFLETLDTRHQLFDALLEARELQIELRFGRVVHANNYEVRLLTRSIKSRRCGPSW